MLACRFCISRKDGREGGGWGHPQDAVHTASAKLSCKRAVVGIRWAKSYPGCMNSLRKHYSQGAHFWQGRLLGF